MRVELLADVSDEQRVYWIGDVCDLPDERAVRWIEAGFVRMLPAAPETATLEPEENAAQPRARKRG
jgi:hypothetical protein